MSEMHEFGRVRVTGLIRLRSGLHIGAGKDSVEIGGIDNPVIKHPHSGEPYIPGSSIKGKLRFLLEWAFGHVRAKEGQARGFNDEQRAEADDAVLRIFGNALKEWQGGPTRLMVRDAPLTADGRARYAEAPDRFFEEKTEVLIDRISGKAKDGGLRQTERVPAGIAFDLELVFRLYALGDDAARDIACLNWLLQGLALLEEDALGGSGSRGYGRIAFEELAMHVAGRDKVTLDNRFRGHVFDRTTPAQIVSAADILAVPA